MEKRKHRAKFSLGQIIRRKLHNGKPVGPYMIIQHIERDRVYADVIGQDTPNEMILKDNVYVPTINSLCISEDMYERLRKGFAICVQHPINKVWEGVYSNPPELIRFYTLPKHYSVVFVVEYVNMVISFREKNIRIVVANQVM